MNIENLELVREVLVGCLLGDAFMETTTNGQTWRLGIEHGKKQESYVYRKHEILSLLCNAIEPPRSKEDNVAFWTPRLEALKKYGDAFYKPRADKKGYFIKVVPEQIKEWLTPRGLAFWYMDDGSKKSKNHKLVYLNTQGFSLEENKFLCEVLEELFSLRVDIKVINDKRTTKTTYQIAIHGDSLEILRKLIEPYMYPEIKSLPLPKKSRGLGKKTIEKQKQKQKLNQN